MKKFFIILGILTLLVIGVLFVPPIYNRFTKPFFKNTVDAKEWYCQGTALHFAVKQELVWNEPSIRF